MVPELKVSVAVAARLAVRTSAAPLRASVVVDLRARSARSESDLPEVIVFSETDDLFFRHSDDVSPDLECLIIVFIYGSPEFFLRHLKPFRAEFPAPLQRFLLEVITEAEVTQHLKECAVAGSLSDVLYIVGPDALLACGHPLFRRCLSTCKIRFERSHSGVDYKKALVVTRDQ